MSMYAPPRRKPRRRRRAPIARVGLPLVFLLLIVAAVYYIFFYPRQIEQTVYPLAYRQEIDQYSKQYGLDPARVAAVIYCESSFRPEAVSSAGARGLMQIMPDTGEWIAGKLGEGDYTHEGLFEPERNIRYGCWYLNYLENRFDADIVKVTAAYHAGGGRVDEWLGNEAYSKDGETLSSIPSDATSTYVKRVQAAYAKYKEIYADEAKKGR